MICCLLLSLSGCASSPVEIPEWDLTPVTEEAQQPLRLPEFPAPASRTEEAVTFTLEQFGVIVDYMTVSGGNYTIAQENAAAIDTLGQAYNQLIDVGKLQRSFTQIVQEQLEREKRDHFMDNWFHRGLIALGVLAAL